MKHLISMQDISKEEILYFMDLAAKIEGGVIAPDLQGKLAALLFFEPSTRTRFSFEVAMKKIGGKTFSMSNTSATSIKKGETFTDTLKTISMYSDLIVMRSFVEGAARFAAEFVDIPVINAGDGTNQHPTQALLDLYSIIKTQKKLDKLTIGIIGDLRFGRTVHSFAQALSSFSPTFYFSSPSHLKMPQNIKDDLAEKKVSFEEVDNMNTVIGKLDIMYVTRIQKERFAAPEDYEKVKNAYIIEKAMLKNVKPNFKVFHPLPRVNEISTDVDSTPYAYYFNQAQNGIFIRQAVIASLLGGV